MHNLWTEFNTDDLQAQVLDSYKMTICYKQQHDYRKEASWMKQMPVSSADLNITGKIIYILRLRKSVYSLIFKWNVLGEIQKYKINFLLSREIKSVIFRNSLLLFRISSGCIYHNPASFFLAIVNLVFNGNDELNGAVSTYASTMILSSKQRLC